MRFGYFDDEKREYVITNKITDHNIQEMRLNMDDKDLAEFDKFVEDHWGSSKRTLANTEETKVVRRAGRPRKTKE